MCVAIIIPPGKKPDVDAMRACRAGHPHGLGLAYYKDENTPVLFTSVKGGEEEAMNFYDMVHKACDENPDKNIFVHFRARTAGAISIENCHPFKLANGFFMHQGGFPGMGSAGYFGPSDSAEMADKIHHLHEDDYSTFLERMKPRLSGNILMFLRYDNKVVRGGADIMGITFEDGCWYSNNWWVPTRNRIIAIRKKLDDSLDKMDEEEARTCFPPLDLDRFMDS